MTTTCRSCGAEILWARTVAGKAIPLDAEPRPDGNVRIAPIGGIDAALVLTDPAERAAAQIEGPVYVTHFATCPNAAEHRRRDAPATAGNP